jgi:HlyD family secretion protein
MAVRRRVWIGLVAAAATVVALAAATRLVRRPALSVAAARVQFGALESWISTNGVIEPVEPYVMASRVSAFVANVLVTEGQTVGRGDLLVALDVEAQRADLARAREALAKAENDVRIFEAGGPARERAQVDGDLRTAESEIDHLRRERDAIDRLVSRQAATSAELSQAQLALDRAEATQDALLKKREALQRDSAADERIARLAVQQSRETVRVLEEQVQSGLVQSPIDGVVYSLSAKRGAHVDTGTVLASVANLGSLRLRAFVDEPELVSVEPDQPVEISRSGLPGQIWHGRTVRVPKNVVPRGDRMVGEVICSVTGDGRRLIPNLGVDVRIQVHSSARALLVPRSSVRSDDSGRYVFVLVNGIVHRRAIVVGRASSTNYAVVEGVGEGEWVALAADVSLRDGMRVHMTSTS